MSVFCRPFQRPVNRRLAFNPINPATPIDQHFVSSSDGPTVPGVQSLPAVRGKGPLDNIGLRLPRPDPSIATEARKKRKVTMVLRRGHKLPISNIFSFN
ncbi:hypothetical protein DAI22_12g218550 [Oryza sativa Japonica Group]|nr:hypothetical protein DAI22_12g218550 [Oryza sativa Japonica Group]